MIQPNELRLGNWVEIFNPYDPNNNHFAQVDSINSEGIDLHPVHDRDDLDIAAETHFKPIPLTHTILEKAGFIPVKNGIGLLVFEGYVSISSLFTGFPLTLDIDGNRMPLYNIKNVHQLQNLYFALTGKELNIQL